MDEIARRPNLPYVTFVLQHLLPRVPVLVPGASAHLPAVARWTPAFFAEGFGRRAVRVDVGGRFEQVLLGEYLAGLDAAAGQPGSHRPYMRNVFVTESFSELVGDVQLPVYCSPNWLAADTLSRLVPPVWKNWMELFISGPGTRFPRAHVDSSMTHAWVIGIHGYKRFWAWPPMENQPSYSIHSEEQQRARSRDCVGKDLESLFGHARPASVEVGPGDFLFLPTGWWHTAESVTTSITLSGNFVNETNWDEFVTCWFHGLRHLPDMESLGSAIARIGVHTAEEPDEERQIAGPGEHTCGVADEEHRSRSCADERS
jgi:hypothetical protein